MPRSPHERVLETFSIVISIVIHHVRTVNSIALRYFNEVARSGSIAAAPLRLHVAGSAVSRQIAALEYEIGARLFERQPRGMILTPAGERLANHVTLSLLEEERVVTEIRSKGERTVGTIRIATSQGLASNFVPEAARLYRQRFRDIRFTVRALSPPGIVASIKEGTADVGIAYALGVHPGISVKHRVVVPTCVILSSKHRLSRRKRLSLDEVKDLPVATSHDTTVRDMINLRSAVVGVRFNVVFECDYSDGLFNYCSAGEAITFASRLSAANWIRRGELSAVPLVDARLYERNVEIQMMEGRTLPGYVEEWIEFLIKRLPDDEFPIKLRGTPKK